MKIGHKNNKTTEHAWTVNREEEGRSSSKKRT
jgi:hypothetical protein